MKQQTTATELQEAAEEFLVVFDGVGSSMPDMAQCSGCGSAMNFGLNLASKN